MWIRKSSQSGIYPTKEVPSIGSMAPCRSHHGNHTRQEWIIIWSGRNWILKHANQPRSLDIKRVAFGVLSLAPCYIWKKAGTSSWRPRMISHFSTGVFVGLSPVEKPQAPCLRIKFLKLGWRRERTEGKKREVLHLCRCYTHTHIYIVYIH